MLYLGLDNTILKVHDALYILLQAYSIELSLIIVYCCLQKSGDVNYQNSQSGDQWSDQFNLENQIGGGGNIDINFGHVLPDVIRSNRDHATQNHIGNQFASSKVNGSLNLIHGGRVASDNSGISQIMAPSITLYNPTRYTRSKCDLYTCSWL